MRKPAYNPFEIARSVVVVAILEGSGIDLINCRCLPPLPDHRRPAVKTRGHSCCRRIGAVHGYSERLSSWEVPAYLRSTTNNHRVVRAPARTNEIAIRREWRSRIAALARPRSNGTLAE